MGADLGFFLQSSDVSTFTLYNISFCYQWEGSCARMLSPFVGGTPPVYTAQHCDGFNGSQYTFGMALIGELAPLCTGEAKNHVFM